MTIFIVSSNQLFKEIIIEAVAPIQTEFIEVNPEDALVRMSELKPDVIIVDETIPPQHLDLLLANLRGLKKIRTIILNPAQNEILLLDACHTKLRKADDLVKVISRSIPEGLIAEDNEGFLAAESASIFSNVIDYLVASMEKPPDANQISMLRIIRVDEIAGFQWLLGVNDEINTGVKMVFDFLKQTAEQIDQETAEILKADWSAVFGSEVLTAQSASHEVFYLDRGKNPNILLTHLENEYAQSGLNVCCDERYNLDRIGTEMSFIGLLSKKASSALEQGNLLLASSIKLQTISFYQDHLGRWAASYLSGVLKQASTGYFQGLVHLSLGVLLYLDKMR